MSTVTPARNTRAHTRDDGSRAFWDYCAHCGDLSAMPPGEWLCDPCAEQTTPPADRTRTGGGRR
jgi:hypothetical protein